MGSMDLEKTTHNYNGNISCSVLELMTCQFFY